MEKNNKLLKLANIMYLSNILILLIAFLSTFILSQKIFNYWEIHKNAIIIITVLTMIIFTYLGGLFNYLGEKNNKKIKINMNFYLIIYLIVVFFFTNFARGTDFLTFNLTPNFIPFKSLIEVIKEVINYGQYNNIVLIIGNILILVPLAYLYPRTIKKINNYPKFILSIIITTLIIEFSQFIIGGGVFDVDDIILNSLGPICFYWVFNKGFFAKVLDKILLLNNDKLKFKDILMTIILIITFIGLFGACIYYYWYHDFATKIDIIDEENSCISAKTFIGEDENYRYYYNCENINKLYIIFNDKDKYLLKDFLNKAKNVKSIYFKKVDISILEGINNVTIESKNPKIEISYTEDSVIPSFSVENIITLSDEKFISNGNDNATYSFILTPKNVGETILKLDFIKFSSNNQEITRTITYRIIVDKNLKVTYEEIK